MTAAGLARDFVRAFVDVTRAASYRLPPFCWLAGLYRTCQQLRREAVPS